MNKKSKKGRVLLATALLAGTAGLVAGTMASANVAGSTFDAFDGNLRVDAGAPQETDWASYPNCANNGGVEPCVHVGIDQATGQNDNSFTQGSKEDDVNVVIGLGSIPNSKADLGKFAVASETIQTAGPQHGHVFIYLGWTRNNLGGTTNFDFEINQAAQPNMNIAPGQPDRAVHLNRTGNGAAAGADDLLVNFDIQGGAQHPTLSLRTWNSAGAGSWSGASMLNATISEGAINASAILAADSGPLAQAIVASAFGEASIDLTAAGIIPDQDDPTAGCTAFGSAYVKSRSSSAFTSQMKDYIAPISIGLDTCASITIVKQTTPDGATQSFNFNPSWKADFLLSDGQSNPSTGLVPGVYSITEDVPLGWTLDSATCSDGSLISAINLGANEDVTCTFNNSGLASLHILKQTDPRGQLGTFGFTSSDLTPATFDLSDNDVAQDFNNIASGTYHVEETSVPAGFAFDHSSCTGTADTDPSDGITLLPGDDVTCIWTNSASGSIHYYKTAERAGTFSFDGSFGPFNLEANGAGQDETGLTLNTAYGVTETVPDGWNLTSQNCTNGETADSVTLLTAGESVDCTFNNVLERGAIDIAKTTVKGNAPLQDIGFSVTNAAGDPVGSGFTNEFGHLCVEGLIVLDGPFTVHEDVPAGYAQDNNDQVVPVTEGDCATAAPVAFENIPLSDIHVQVHSQIPGATASSIDCQPTDVPPVPISDEPVLDALDLRPGVYTCTIVIDP